MGRDRGTLYAALASTLLSVLLAIAVNVGTGGALPGPLAAAAPLAWPLVGLLTVLTVWLAVRGSRNAPPGRPGRVAEAGEPPSPSPAGPARPAELPAADGYTGRADDLDRLRALARGGRRAIVVAGPPGIGKSSLAVRLAHELAGDYPDGQLVAALGGGSGTAADPAAVLADLLDRLGAAVPGTTDPDRLAAHWRSTLAGRRMLILLDDARDAAQVRPLQPGAPGCLTLITSRSPLAGLAGSVTYDLDVLTEADAVALLREAGGGDRVDAEPVAAAEVAVACGALPLAVAIAGARLRRRPAWRVADLAARLRDERVRLDMLYAEETGVRASFATAYDDLPDADRRAFRALGAYPGRELPAGAAAALTGDPDAVERLVDARLVDAVGADRYRLHDLLRLYARERLAAEDPAQAAEDAFARLVDWYLAALPRAGAGWIDAEVENVALAVRAALDRDAGAAHRLAVAADVPLLHRTEHIAFLGICRDRLAAAEALGDTRARDVALTRLGETANAYGLVGEGTTLLGVAVERWADRGDPAWLAHACKGLGVALRDAGRYAEAVSELEAALAYFTAAGDHRRAAQTLTDLGVVLVIRNEPERAIEALDRARTLAATATDTHPQERVWPLLPYASALLQQARYAEARPLLEEAVRGFRDPPNYSGQGLALLDLGDAADFTGDPAQAARHYEAARAAFARVDYRPGLALAAQALGHHHARHDRPDPAASAFATATDAYEQLGNRPNAGLNLLWRAEQLRALGRRADADAAQARGEVLLDGSDLPQAEVVRARLRGDPDAQPRPRPR